MAATATRGAVRFPRRVGELLRAGLDLRNRHLAGQVGTHGLAVARGRLENQLSDLVFPPKTNATNERLAQHLLTHHGELLRSCVSRGWRLPTDAELAIRFGVIRRKVWGGNRTQLHFGTELRITLQFWHFRALCGPLHVVCVPISPRSRSATSSQRPVTSRRLDLAG